MARLPRLNIPGIPQHVVQRGNNRQVCFYADEDYGVYLDKLKEYSRKYQVSVRMFQVFQERIWVIIGVKTLQRVPWQTNQDLKELNTRHPSLNKLYSYLSYRPPKRMTWC